MVFIGDRYETKLGKGSGRENVTKERKWTKCTLGQNWAKERSKVATAPPSTPSTAGVGARPGRSWHWLLKV